MKMRAHTHCESLSLKHTHTHTHTRTQTKAHTHTHGHTHTHTHTHYPCLRTLSFDLSCSLALTPLKPIWLRWLRTAPTPWMPSFSGPGSYSIQHSLYSLHSFSDASWSYHIDQDINVLEV